MKKGASTIPLIRRPSIFDGIEIIAGFSTRFGGSSAPPYDSLNLGVSTGDDAAEVDRNRARLFRAAGLDPQQVAIAGQVHGSAVHHVSGPGLYPGFDALVTNTPLLTLAITAADCAVVLLADEEHPVVGAAHSGWRGTLAGIIPRTVDAMVQLGGHRENMRAYVSPCISSDRFEVGEEVAALFPEALVVRRASWPRPHIDLRAAIDRQLTESGLEPARVEVSQECTYDHPDFFSYRAEAGKTGRMMGFIALTA